MATSIRVYGANTFDDPAITLLRIYPPEIIAQEHKNTWAALAGVAQWIAQGLRTKGSPVQFPVRAHAWVASRGPSIERQSHTDTSLPLVLLLFHYV